jgi:hypothetical protein
MERMPERGGEKSYDAERNAVLEHLATRDPELHEALTKFTGEENDAFDRFLNMEGMGWGNFKSIDASKKGMLLETVERWRSGNRDGRREAETALISLLQE